ncbi:MAG: hypothetical protein WCD66_04215 [Rhodanobacteraceae bacterium]
MTASIFRSRYGGLQKAKQLAITLAILCVSGCAAPLASRDAEHTDRVQVIRADREFDLDKSVRRVRIVNYHGDIRVKRHDEDTVAIHAVIQRLPPSFARLQLHARRDNGVLQIETGYAKRIDPATPGRIDLAVFLPSATAVSLETRADRIVVGAREGITEATSSSGRISASSRGRLVLHSESGSIQAAALGGHWQGESRIETRSGQIVLLVPTFGGITLDASTGARLSTDFGLSVHRQPDGNMRAHARYGDGKSRLLVNSADGEVILEQLVRSSEDGELPDDDD